MYTRTISLVGFVVAKRSGIQISSRRVGAASAHRPALRSVGDVYVLKTYRSVPQKTLGLSHRTPVYISRPRTVRTLNQRTVGDAADGAQVERAIYFGEVMFKAHLFDELCWSVFGAREPKSVVGK